MKKIILFSISILLICCQNIFAQLQDIPVIYVGDHSTTHLLFTTDLTYVDISTPECVAAKIVDASKNMLALKAKKEFDYSLTISCLEANGTMHTFMLAYNPSPEKLIIDTRINAKNNSQTNHTYENSNNKEQQSNSKQNKKNGTIDTANSGSSNFGKVDAPTIEDIVKTKKQDIFHIGDRNFDVEIYCANIYVYSDMTYLVLDIYNKTDIGYEAGEAQFTVENLVRDSKSLSTDKPIWAKSSYGSLSCPPRSYSKMGYIIPKLTLLKNECLRIYIYEKSGKRNLILTLTDKDMNYAISPKNK